jgi:hypothetical protein
MRLGEIMKTALFDLVYVVDDILLSDDAHQCVAVSHKTEAHAHATEQLNHCYHGHVARQDERML